MEDGELQCNVRSMCTSVVFRDSAFYYSSTGYETVHLTTTYTTDKRGIVLSPALIVPPSFHTASRAFLIALAKHRILSFTHSPGETSNLEPHS